MVAVTIPAEIGDTSIPASKLIVPAVPTKDPLSLTITPLPAATMLVNSDPSPMNFGAVILLTVVIVAVESN